MSIRNTPSSRFISLILGIWMAVEPLALAESQTEALLKNDLPLPGNEFILRSSPDQPLIPVRLLGGVKRPGIYHIPVGTVFTTLISFAGGLDGDADSDKILISNRKRQSVTQVNLEELLKRTERPEPVLLVDDLIYVPQYKSAVSKDTTVYLSVISSVVAIIVGGIFIFQQTKK